MSEHARRVREPKIFSTIFQRWYAAERKFLFPSIKYSQSQIISLWKNIPRLGGGYCPSVWNKILHCGGSDRLPSHLGSGALVFYQEAAQYYVKASGKVPYFKKNGKVCAPPHGRFVDCAGEQSPILVAILSSSLFYLWYQAISDCYHLSDAVVQAFPCPRSVLADSTLRTLGRRLETELHKNAKIVKISTTKGEEIAYAAFNCQASKSINDEIDDVLGRQFGLSNEELDYVINFEVKYRMGAEASEDVE